MSRERVPKMHRVLIAATSVALCLPACVVSAQDVTNESLPGAARVQRTPEPAVAGLSRRDPMSVAFALPAHSTARPLAPAELLLHDFDFNGEPVTTDKLHLRQVAPGVVEITSVAWEVGYWRFHVRDARQLLRAGRALRHAGPRAHHCEEPLDGQRRREGHLHVQADSVLHEHHRLWAVAGHDGRGDVRHECERPRRDRPSTPQPRSCGSCCSPGRSSR